MGTHLVDPFLFDYFLFSMCLCQKSTVYSSKPHHLKKLKARVINTIYEVTHQLKSVSTDWKIRLNDVSGKLAARSMARNINVFVWNDMDFVFMLHWHHVYSICMPVLLKLKMSKDSLNIIFWSGIVKSEEYAATKWKF